jgi:uncharacterized DUF497 family protein
MLHFDWDLPKDEENRRRHHISFAAASVALEDPYAMEEVDSIVEGELRLRTTGMAAGEVIVLVTHTNTLLNDSGDELARIISARKASAGERREYEQFRTTNSW